MAAAAKQASVEEELPRRRARGRRPWEGGTIVGVLLALGCVLAGCTLEGESIRFLLQPTALAVVGVGTLAALLVQFPVRVVGQTLKAVGGVFRRSNGRPEEIARALVGYARQAQESGLLSLDAQLEGIDDAYLRKALTMAVDGLKEADIRASMALEGRAQDHAMEAVDEMLETAAAVAPPLGILGAVLGLLHVMRLLNDFNQVGQGIAAAFVSTLYGVALSNLFLLPLAGRVRLRETERRRQQEMTLEGVLGILAKTRPRVLEVRLGSYTVRTQVRPRPQVLAG